MRQLAFTEVIELLNFKNAHSASAVAQIAATKLTKNLHQSASQISLGAMLAVTVVAGAAALAPEMAFAQATGCYGTVDGVVEGDQDRQFSCAAETTNERRTGTVATGRAFQTTDGKRYDLTIDEGFDVTGYGLSVRNLGTGRVSMDNNGSITIGSETPSDAINERGTIDDPFVVGDAAMYLESNGGAINYTGTGGITNYGGGNGLGVVSGGGSVVNLVVGGDVLVKNGAAISVVDAADVDSNNDGVLDPNPSGDITIETEGTVTGVSGIAVNTNSGKLINITTNEAVNSFGGNAIEVSGKGTVTLTTTGVVAANTVTGEDPDGPESPLEPVVTGGSAILVDMDAGDVTLTTSAAVSAIRGTVATADNLSISNSNIASILLRTDEGDITTTIGGDVTTDYLLAGAVLQTGAGDIDFTLSEDATISGPVVGAALIADGGGVTATFNGDVNGATIDEAGIEFAAAMVLASDAIDLNLNGKITATGDASYALYVQGGAAIDVNNTDTITNAASNKAVYIYSADEILDADRDELDFDPDDYVVSFANSGTVQGAVQIAANNYTISLANSGTLSGGISTAQSGGALNLTNAVGGVINGKLDLIGAESGGVTNEGTINLSAGESIVEGGFYNSGTLNFLSGGVGEAGASLIVRNAAAANPLVRTFAASSAPAFVNEGTLNLANGDANTVFIIEGDYVGDNGTITMDYAADGSAYDTITIGGNASGTTTVILKALDGEEISPKLFNGNFMNLITVAGETEEGGFVFGGVEGLEFPTTGLVLTNFAANPDDGQQFGLIQSLNAASRAMGHIAHITESASAVLDESISPYLTQKKVDGKAVQLGAWGRIGTGTLKQQLGAAVSGYDLETSGVDKVRTKNESLQAGFDFGAINIGGGDWSVNVGVTGGWYEADAAIYGLGSVDIEAEFLGGYAVIGNGKLKLEGQMRRESRDLKVTFADLAATRMIGESTAWLGNVRASYRVGAEAGLAVTPFAEYRFGSSKFDSITVDDLASFQQASHKRKYVELGAEVGYRKFAASGLNFEPFVGAAWLKNDSNRANGNYVFSEDANEFATVGQAWDEAVRLSWGLKAESASGRYGVVLNGNTIQAKDVKSVGVQVGGRINF